MIQMEQFKIGDLVECIDLPRLDNVTFYYGKTYKVIDVDYRQFAGYIKLEGIDYWLDSTRFIISRSHLRDEKLKQLGI